MSAIVPISTVNNKNTINGRGIYNIGRACLFFAAIACKPSPGRTLTSDIQRGFSDVTTPRPVYRPRCWTGSLSDFKTETNFINDVRRPGRQEPRACVINGISK